MAQMNGHSNGNGLPVARLPDDAIKCKWHPGTEQKSPHEHKRSLQKPRVVSNILEVIGNTPIVKLNKIPQSAGLKCDIYVKCEFLSPGGSIKDRIAIRMLEDAENSGLIKPGYTIIENTSGNTGLGLAMACAVKGYKFICVMSIRMSTEKMDALRALGAKVVTFARDLASDDDNGPFAIAQKLNKEIPNSIILNQYKHPGNPMAHYDGTAEEILNAFDDKIDMIIMGAGTGGTITGVGRKLRERCPECKIVVVDPCGSILAVPDSMNNTDDTKFEVEGIGYDFVPTALDRTVVDEWLKVKDKDIFNLARRLIREEGLLCGGSSGAMLLGALTAAKRHGLKEGQKCVIILPDGVRNYMTKFLDPIWMEARGYMEPEAKPFKWWNARIDSMDFPKPEAITKQTTCRDAINKMKKANLSQLAVVSETGKIVGAVTLKYLMRSLNAEKVKLDDPVAQTVYDSFRVLSPSQSLGLASRMLENESFVIIGALDVKPYRSGELDIERKANEKPLTDSTYIGMLTTMDLLDL